MLAYVFWHWPQPGVDAGVYLTALREFHDSLAAGKPEGFIHSCAYRLNGAPWLPGDAYEDWYVIEDSSALDPINEAAVAGRRKEPHDRAARLAAGGTAGLYRFRQGHGDLGASRAAAWFSKPAGTSYEEFFARLAFWTSRSKHSLWGRQMTLGPTPEFCLLAPQRPDLPDTFGGVMIDLIRVWPES
jgi:hypothetical protein